MLGRIYKITNKINNKVYIGQTIQTLKERWYRHIGNSKSLSEAERSMVIKRAILKYGKENFSIEILEECEASKLDEREIYYIAYYDSYNNGYNSTKGGVNTKGISILKLDSKAEIIIDLYKTGFSLRAIAKEFQVDKNTIKNVLKRNDIEIRKVRNYKYSSQERQNIIDEFNSGVSKKEIINKYHISKSYLSQLLNNKRRI